MRDVLIRSIFGTLFLLVIFVPYVYDLQHNGNLMTLVFFVFSLLGVHELFVMQTSSPFTSNLKVPALLLTTALFIPFVLNALQGIIPINQNPFFDFLANNMAIYMIGFGVFAISLIVFSVWIFQTKSIDFVFKQPLIFGFFYPVLPLWILSFAYNTSSVFDKQLILIVLLPIYLNDTLAYVSGRLFGKTPLIPAVSPKKTWEGFIGGLIGAALVMNIVIALVGELTVANAFGISLVSISASFLATLGDLFESKLKRSVGVKDSGKLLPGHGGILDRIDAMLFVTPVLYVILKAIYI